MLSYRHAFHAGNHADVLKHLSQVLILDYLLQKQDKALCYIDTHAGPGAYSLGAGFAQKNREFETGIARLWQASDLPAPVARYVQIVKAFNAGDALTDYPGSPAIARELLRPGDRLQLFELHPDDFSRLRQWRHGERSVQVQQEDGFERLPAILPPGERRALVLIDPPFEVKQDYQRAVSTLELALKRFATGVYLLWYPLLGRPEIVQMLDGLKKFSGRYLHAELRVKDPNAGGMFGSGIFVINPPWQLEQQLRESLPCLEKMLGQDGDAAWALDTQGLD